MTTYDQLIGQLHFQRSSGLEFSDLFRPVPVPSTARARTFLWLCYHYLEPSSPNRSNPFDDPSDDRPDRNPDLAPPLRDLSPAELALLPPENVDTPEEKAWAEKMAEYRRAFLDRDKERQDAGNASRNEPSEGGETPAREPTQPSSPPPASGSVLTIMPPGVTASIVSNEETASKDGMDQADTDCT